jgi:hypothetical protein
VRIKQRKKINKTYPRQLRVRGILHRRPSEALRYAEHGTVEEVEVATSILSHDRVEARFRVW